MRLISILLAFAAGALALPGLASAQSYPWCANFADGAGVNCGFSTYEQCMAVSQGSGGFCTRNNLYGTPAAAAPAHRPVRRRRTRPTGNNLSAAPTAATPAHQATRRRRTR